jgi:hypothetical protein
MYFLAERKREFDSISCAWNSRPRPTCSPIIQISKLIPTAKSPSLRSMADLSFMLSIDYGEICRAKTVTHHTHRFRDFRSLHSNLQFPDHPGLFPSQILSFTLLASRSDHLEAHVNSARVRGSVRGITPGKRIDKFSRCLDSHQRDGVGPLCRSTVFWHFFPNHRQRWLIFALRGFPLRPPLCGYSVA